MASSLPLKRFLTSIPLSRSFLRPVASSAARSFNTNVVLRRQYDENSDDSNSDVDIRSDHFLISRVDYFSDGSEILEHPFSPAARGGWDAKETEDAMHLRVDMPGLGKEDVKISVKPNTFTLTIKREGAKESSDEEEGARRYSSRIDLSDKVYKFDQIKAEMKNGELKVVVPKRKEKERPDVFNVKIE